MDKQDPPQSFGVFKPTGHTVLAFADEQTARSAIDALADTGIACDDIVHYRPAEMQAQATESLDQASGLAAIGQELNLIKALGEMAADGCHFIVAPHGDQAQTDRIRAVAERLGARRAQRFGRFVIEELLPGPEPQVGESPDRGLDDEEVPPGGTPSPPGTPTPRGA